jgi:hypothetical protein
MKRQQQQYMENKYKLDAMNSATDRSLDDYLIKELESSSNASTSSKLSINPDIDNIINATHQKISKKNTAQYKMESVDKNDIDVISLGDRSRGTKSKGSKGSTKSRGSNKSKKGINLSL